MTTKYYRSNNSDWNTDANWSTTSGGGADTTFPTAGDDAIFDDNSGNCTLDLAAACDKITIGTVGALYTGTLDAATYDVTIGTGGLDCTYGGSATLDLGSGTWTCSGDWDSQDLGTLTPGTSRVKLTGLTKNVRTHGTNGPLYELEITGSYTHTDSSSYLAITSGLYVSGSLINSDTIYATNADVQNTGSITGAAKIQLGYLTNSSNISVQSGTLSVPLDVQWGSTICAATYGGAVTFSCSSSLTRTSTWGAGTYTFEDVFAVDEAHPTGTYVMDLATNNPDMAFQGNVTISESGGGTVTWTKGTGTITLSGSSNQTITTLNKPLEDIVIDKTAGDIQLADGLTTESFTGTSTGTGDFDPNEQTLTIGGNCSWAAAFTMEGSADHMNGSDWQVTGNFTANGQSLSATAGWDLDVTGTAVASGTGDVEYCTAGGTEIDASAGPWTDNGNNTNWNFGSSGGPINVMVGGGIFG